MLGAGVDVVASCEVIAFDRLRQRMGFVFVWVWLVCEMLVPPARSFGDDFWEGGAAILTLLEYPALVEDIFVVKVLARGGHGGFRKHAAGRGLTEKIDGISHCASHLSSKSLKAGRRFHTRFKVIGGRERL